MSENHSKPLYTLTVAEYVELNKKVFSEAAATLLEKQAEPVEEESDIIFVDDVLKITGYSKATIYTKVCRFEIPVLSRRKPLTFSKTDILQWLRDGKPNLIDREAEDYMKEHR